MINPLLTFLRTLTKRNFSTNIAEISQLLKGSEIVLLSLPALVANFRQFVGTIAYNCQQSRCLHRIPHIITK